MRALNGALKLKGKFHAAPAPLALFVSSLLAALSRHCVVPPVGVEHGKNQLQRLSLSARDHPAIRPAREI